jgi:hypothetical protein
MRVTALAVEEEWRERLGPDGLAAFRGTLLTLLAGDRMGPGSQGPGNQGPGT